MPDNLVKTAVVTGRHPFDLPAFTHLFRALPGIDPYIQHMDDFVVDVGKARDWYDAVVFYHFHQETPGAADDDVWWTRGMRTALERLGETSQGIVILHHAMLAFRDWPLWSELVGIKTRGRGFYHDQQITVRVADPDHPITQGLDDWEMVDETYTVDEPGADSHLLLTTDHPHSMHALAWTRTHKQARVFCCALGHDAQAFENPQFRTVLTRGIRWAAQQL